LLSQNQLERQTSSIQINQFSKTGYKVVLS
jgi:hypothetical protein